MTEISLSPKQYLAWSLLDDPTVVELGFGGGAGGGKTLLVTEWAVKECKRYPGIRIGLGRKEITTLRKTTVQTLLTETHALLGVREGDFRYSSMIDPGIYYRNGSAIIFVDLAPAPTDPNFDRLGSLNLTHVIIEEAGEIDRKARAVFTSRKNRLLNEKYAITGKTILTCNPSQNFMRDQFYEPYAELGAGDHQTWPHGNVIVEGETCVAKRAFVKSLPTDNPFLSQNYIENLRMLPETERRRLLEGDWDYEDDENKLFKTHLFRTTDKSDGDSWAGCDPSRGGDGCLFSQLQGNVLVDLVKLAIPADDPHLDIGTFVAQKYMEFCARRGIGADRAAVDVVGIGASVQDACNRLGFHIRAFNAGSTKGVRLINHRGQLVDHPRNSSDGVALFNNLRSQGYYDIADAAHTGTLKFIEDLPYYSELKRDFGAHQYETKERQTVVASKDKVKKLLGRSPDYSDSVLAAWWCKNDKPRGGFRVRMA